LSPSDLPTQVWDQLQQVLGRFEDAWQRGERPKLEDYLHEGGAHRQVLLVELAHEDLEYRFGAGEGVRVEAYLERYPELRSDPDAALSLIAAEYAQRRRREAGCTAEEYQQRFPEYATELAKRLATGSGQNAPWTPPGFSGGAGKVPPARESEEQTNHKPPRAAALASAAPTNISGWPVVPGYEILAELGRGGMGMVYKARHLALQRLVAVKLLRADNRDLSETEGRFLEEAQLTGQLQHPGIPPVHEVGVLPDGRPFLAMKLIQGRTLTGLLQERSAPAADLPRFLAIFEQVCRTLAYAHARGVIHRDLKPANIMVGAFGEVQVMDWGLAKQTRAGDPELPAVDQRSVSAEPVAGAARVPPTKEMTGGGASSTPCPDRLTPRTRPGSVLGTPAYMPPEQAQGEVDRLDERSDVFGLGAVLCEICTGQPPYRGPIAHEVHGQAARGDLADAFARLDTSGADTELVRLAKACLDPDRDWRPRDAGVVERAVTAHLEGIQERLRQAELERAAAEAKAREERKRRRLKAGLVVALAALVALGAGGGVWLTAQKAEQQAESARQARAVALALEQTAALLRHGRWAEAKATLDQADSRLGEGAPADLSGRLRQARKDLALVAQLEEIRLQRQVSLDRKVADAAADRAYLAAFTAARLLAEKMDAAAAARRIESSAVRAHLVAALDDWAFVAGKQRRTWVLEVARLADPHRARDQFRDPAVWNDGPTLARLAAEAKVADLSPEYLAVLGQLLHTHRLKAVTFLRAAQAQHPGDFWLNLTLGEALTGSQPEEAAGFYRAAVAARPRNAAAHVLLAITLKRCGRKDEALASFRKAVECEPTFAPSRTLLADFLTRMGRREEAYRQHHKAIELAPRDARARVALGQALVTDKHLDEGIAAYKKAIELDPTFAAAHSELGTVLRKKGWLDQAIASHREAIRLKPLNALYHYSLGVALKSRGLRDKAIAAFRTALDINPNYPEALGNLGGVLLAQGRMAEALPRLQKAIELNDRYAQAHCNLATLLAKKGRTKDAIAHYHKAMEADPMFAQPHTDLGLLLARMGQFTRALAPLRKAVEIDPTYGRGHDALGRILVELGHPDEAFRCFRRAVKGDPNDADAWSSLGRAQLSRGLLDEAVASYRRSVKLGPEDARPHLGLAEALHARGLLDDAVRSSRKALELIPRDSPVHRVEARKLQRRERLAQADRKLEALLRDEVRLGGADRLLAAELCRLRGRFAASARLYAMVLVEEPQLIEDGARPYRMDAAGAAVLAAEHGKDIDKRNGADRGRLRRQALAWLRDDLLAFERAVAANPNARSPIRWALAYLQTVPDFASVRDPKRRAQLPPEEREEWQRFWTNVATFLRRLQEPE
jgi:serine/threonine-protein kinase